MEINTRENLADTKADFVLDFERAVAGEVIASAPVSQNMRRFRDSTSPLPEPRRVRRSTPRPEGNTFVPQRTRTSPLSRQAWSATTENNAENAQTASRALAGMLDQAPPQTSGLELNTSGFLGAWHNAQRRNGQAPARPSLNREFSFAVPSVPSTAAPERNSFVMPPLPSAASRIKAAEKSTGEALVKHAAEGDHAQLEDVVLNQITKSHQSHILNSKAGTEALFLARLRDDERMTLLLESEGATLNNREHIKDILADAHNVMQPSPARKLLAQRVAQGDKAQVKHMLTQLNASHKNRFSLDSALGVAMLLEARNATETKELKIAGSHWSSSGVTEVQKEARLKRKALLETDIANLRTIETDLRAYGAHLYDQASLMANLRVAVKNKDTASMQKIVDNPASGIELR